MSCLPSYNYTPSFAPGGGCIAPTYTKHRSRVLVEPTSPKKATSLFFRSRDQSDDSNHLEVEQTTDAFNVYFRGNLIESYPSTPFVPMAISNLRAALSSSVVEMPIIGIDKYDDVRTSEEDGDGEIPIGGTEAVGGLAPFSRVQLAGGAGAPTDSTSISTINTGPTRTVYIITTEEDMFGEDVNPQDKVMQWNGVTWIAYCNTVPGECPGEGTC